jgi:hypothetical protein
VTILLVRHAEPIAPGDPRYQENELPMPAVYRLAAGVRPLGPGFDAA